jgi:hypothetical protein
MIMLSPKGEHRSPDVISQNTTKPCRQPTPELRQKRIRQKRLAAHRATRSACRKTAQERKE